MTNPTTATASAGLSRTLGLRSLVLFGLAYLTPMIVLGIFGVIASASEGASASAYLIALVAMLFTAASYGRLAARFPVAGSAYTYVGRSIDGRAGYLVGWAVLLDYLFLPMVIWLIGASYLTAAVPGVPSWVWIVGFMVITTVLNIVGIKVADRVNFVLMAFQFLVIALIGGGIFIVVTYFTQLVHPGGSFADESSAAFEIAQTIGGNVFSAVFVAGLIIAQFTSGLAAQASGSRLLYAMGRDGVLPRRIFAIVHRGFHTPWGAIVVVGVVGLIALFLDVATSTSFVNFGAFIAFAMVNISVIVLAVRSRRDGAPANVLLDYVFPAVGALVIIGLLTQLDSNALIIGGVWVAVGLVILATLTGGFRRQPPSVDPDAFAG